MTQELFSNESLLDAIDRTEKQDTIDDITTGKTSGSFVRIFLAKDYGRE